MDFEKKAKEICMDPKTRGNAIEAIERALADAYAAGWKKCRDKIEDIIAEFGDDPKACAAIIGEHLRGGTNVEY